MPIKGISNLIRLPRLGKIHLGEKVESPGKNPYPRATDYFVCPKEVRDICGEKPKELHILFPTDDPDQFAQQWLRAYSLTQGLVCIGDGETCRRKVDKKSGAFASHITEVWEWRDSLPCNPQECPVYVKRDCKRVMNLQVCLPDVPGIGVWQIDTSSFYSIVNINSMVALLQSWGRCRMIPLILTMGEQEVSPEGQKKKKVHVLQLKLEMTMGEVVRLAAQPVVKLFLPVTVDDEEAPTDLFPEVANGAKETPSTSSVDKDIEELWPTESKKTKPIVPASRMQDGPPGPAPASPAKQLPQDRVDALSRALTAIGYLPGLKRDKLIWQLNVDKLADLTVEQANNLEAWAKRKVPPSERGEAL